MRSTVCRIAVLSVALSALGGCAAAPIAALGVVGNATDIGSAAFTAGTEVFTSGKLETVEFAAFDQAERAIRSALNDLRLDSRREREDKTHLRFDVIDDYDGKTRIDLWRRSSALVDMRVDVGWFGSEAFARLLLKSIRHRLPAAATPAATQPASPVDLQAPRTYDSVNSPPSD